MWSIKRPTVHDAYQQFQLILHHWLRLLGLVLGQDIFQGDFRIHLQTKFVLVAIVSIPLLLSLTSYRFHNELGMMAGVFVILALKVRIAKNNAVSRLDVDPCSCVNRPPIYLPQLEEL